MMPDKISLSLYFDDIFYILFKYRGGYGVHEMVLRELFFPVQLWLQEFQLVVCGPTATAGAEC
jgi:hypothetical protein